MAYQTPQSNHPSLDIQLDSNSDGQHNSGEAPMAALPMPEVGDLAWQGGEHLYQGA